MQFFSRLPFPYQRFSLTPSEKEDLNILFVLFEKDEANIVSYLLEISPTVITKFMLSPTPKDPHKRQIRQKILALCHTDPILESHWLSELNEMTHKNYTSRSLSYTEASAFFLYIGEYLYRYRSDTCVRLYRLEDEKKENSFEYDILLEELRKGKDIAIGKEEWLKNQAVLVKACELGHFQAFKLLAKLWRQKDKDTDESQYEQRNLFKWALKFHGTPGLIVMIRYVWGKKERPANSYFVFYLAQLAMALNPYTNTLADGLLSSDALLHEYFSALPSFNKMADIMTYLSQYLSIPKFLYETQAVREAQDILTMKGLLPPDKKQEIFDTETTKDAPELKPYRI